MCTTRFGVENSKKKLTIKVFRVSKNWGWFLWFRAGRFCSLRAPDNPEKSFIKCWSNFCCFIAVNYVIMVRKVHFVCSPPQGKSTAAKVEEKKPKSGGKKTENRVEIYKFFGFFLQVAYIRRWSRSLIQPSVPSPSSGMNGVRPKERKSSWTCC